MRKHIILTATGLLAGVLALAWLRPNTAAGATFLIFLSIVVVNAIGILCWRSDPARKAPHHRHVPVVWPILLCSGTGSLTACQSPGPSVPAPELAVHSAGTVTAIASVQGGGSGGHGARTLPPARVAAKTRPARGEVHGVAVAHRAARRKGRVVAAPITDQGIAPPSTGSERPAADRPSAAQITASLMPGGSGGETTRGIRLGSAPSERMLRPARAFLRAAEIPPAAIGAYGVVALRARSTAASRQRLLGVCTAFVASLPRQDTLPGSVALGDQMLTVWPLDNPEAEQARLDTCEFLVDHYDLYGGLSAIQDAERQGASLDGRGPFLIGWSPSNSRGIADKIVLIVDMSAFESQDSFDNAFRFWQEKIVQDPALWRSGFSIEGVRLALRDFVDHYGGNILDAVKLAASK